MIKITKKDRDKWFEEINSCRKISSNRHALDRQYKNKHNPNRKPLDDEILENNIAYPISREYLDYSYGAVNNGNAGANAAFSSGFRTFLSPHLDKNTDRKLARGKIKIDRKIDFHGLTLDEAFNLLLNTVIGAERSNMRCLLLITGKGNNTKSGRDSIKSQLPLWLRHPAIAPKIIKCTTAVQKDGGTGAFYLLLRRKRKYN